MTATLDDFLNSSFDDFLNSSTSHEAARQLQMMDDFSRYAMNQGAKDPVHASRAEAIAFLQAEKHRPSSTQREHAVHCGKGEPYSRHIALVIRVDENGREVKEYLHATKGWKRGQH